ncbi:type IV conjugative transfer system lipoprotein TraV [Citrobacter sedlakii]|uniref:type IV conjugative transfer system lipoprotein TraV n=1 Tax=Citrobacter sedlakii TaxID=67826 RepID=UPI0020BF984F|nr:type IV conjugative transfer system lipoprotein TraV [Citrobacter sedlakii]MCK8148041.1 type IV conjugative transfer system lipoprotein TraV [Citrobacter sedlakii]
MKLKPLFALVGVALLAGCSGSKSTFDCDITASDVCMTISQANEQAKLKTQEKQSGGARSLPEVAKPSPKLISPPGISGTKVITPAPAKSDHRVSGVVKTPLTSPVYSSPLKPAEKPVRAAERTGKIWVAPWIDSDGAYHSDSMISIVVQPGEWH